MIHTKDSLNEGKGLIYGGLINASIGSCIIYFLDISHTWKICVSLFLLVMVSFFIVEGVRNLRANGMYHCELTEHEFIQKLPTPKDKDNFSLLLSEIITIELMHRHGNPRWYIHTEEQRYLIMPCLLYTSPSPRD